MNPKTQKIRPGCSVLSVSEGSIENSKFLLVKFSSPDGENFQLLIPEGCVEAVEIDSREKDSIFTSNSGEDSTESSSDDESFFLTYIDGDDDNDNDDGDEV